MPTDTTLTLVSCPPEAAAALARQLVELQLAACISILPGVESVYRWQGEVQQAREALLLIKTAADRVDALKAAVLAHHPYELPEFITVNVAQGHAPYLQWIFDSSRPPA